MSFSWPSQVHFSNPSFIRVRWIHMGWNGYKCWEDHLHEGSKIRAWWCCYCQLPEIRFYQSSARHIQIHVPFLNVKHTEQPILHFLELIIYSRNHLGLWGPLSNRSRGRHWLDSISQDQWSSALDRIRWFLIGGEFPRSQFAPKKSGYISEKEDILDPSATASSTSQYPEGRLQGKHYFFTLPCSEHLPSIPHARFCVKAR